MGTDAADIAVGEEAAALGAVELFNRFFGDETRGIELFEDVLGYLGLNRRGCASEYVKGDIEPAVNFVMDGVVAVAQFAGA